MRNSQKILVGKLKGSNNFGDLDVDGRIILRTVVKKGMTMRTIQNAQDMIQMDGAENTVKKKPSGTIKHKEFLN
jgi:hypothetical protein